MFFQKNGQRLNCFCHVYSFGLCQTHLQYTKTHGILGDQIAYTVGHGAPGTFELMNYHLLHVKCHCRFMPLEQGEFSISATTLSLIFSQVAWWWRISATEHHKWEWESFASQNPPVSDGYKLTNLHKPCLLALPNQMHRYRHRQPHIYVLTPLLRKRVLNKTPRSGLIILIRADRGETAKDGEKTMCRTSTVCGP